MTLLMWQQTQATATAPAAYLIMTDTLAVEGVSGTPALFECKLHPMLHRDMIMMGTGNLGLSRKWARWLEVQPVYDLEMLNILAPAVLRQMWEELLAECDELRAGRLGTGSSTTIYHFTISQGRARTYIYRSTSDFEAEVDEDDGQYQKPYFGQRADDPDSGMFMPFATIEEMIDAACRIRADQYTQPADKRVHIDGELYLTTFAPGIYTHQRVHIFEDRNEMATRMLLDRGIDIADGIHIDVEPNAEPLDLV
jgi:hypothetical protein